MALQMSRSDLPWWLKYELIGIRISNSFRAYEISKKVAMKGFKVRPTTQKAIM